MISYFWDRRRQRERQKSTFQSGNFLMICTQKLSENTLSNTMEQIHSSSWVNRGKNGIDNKRNCFIDCSWAITPKNHSMNVRIKEKYFGHWCLHRKRDWNQNLKLTFTVRPQKYGLFTHDHKCGAEQSKLRWKFSVQNSSRFFWKRLNITVEYYIWKCILSFMCYLLPYISIYTETCTCVIQWNHRYATVAHTLKDHQTLQLKSHLFYQKGKDFLSFSKDHWAPLLSNRPCFILSILEYSRKMPADF